MQRYPETARVRGAQVRDQALAGPTELFERQYDSGFGVVVVVADRHRPGQSSSILGAGGHLGLVERVVVDGAAHGAMIPHRTGKYSAAMSPTEAIPPRSAAVDAAAKAWSGQLIDLGGRNSLLHFRDLRAGTLDLTDADPPSIARLLDRRAVRLSALFPGDLLADAARRVRTISAKARENLEERGLSTLFIGREIVTWDAGSTTATVAAAAPLLLAEMSVRSLGALETDFELAVTDDWEPNPTLLHVLSTTFQVRIVADDLLTAVETASGDLSAAGRALLTAAATAVPGLGLAQRTVVGNFSYAKQPMVLDLEAGLDVMCGNDVIAALAGDRQAIAALRSATVTVGLGEPDRTLPDDEFIVVDADASQHLVINAAVSGANLVVQGPPGTGKSQTIANLIATLAANGRSVLFVAEKRAAIDAVVKRLQRAGLGDLVLDLYGGGGSRRTMAAELRRVYDASSTVPAVHRDGDEARLVELRGALNEHAVSLHQVRSPWQTSAYELQSIILGVPDEMRLPLRLSGSVSAPDRQGVRRIADALADWVTTGGPAISRGSTPWSVAAPAITTSAVAESALALARSLASETVPAVAALLDAALVSCGLRRPVKIAAWADLVALFEQVAAVSAVHDAPIWQADLDALALGMRPAAGSAAGRLMASMFDGGYRRAKKQAAVTARSPQPPAELLASVSAAASARRAWSALAADGGPPRLPAQHEAVVAGYRRLVDDLGTLAGFVGRAGLLDVDVADITRTVDALLADSATLFRLPRLAELAVAIDGAGFASVRAAVAERNLDASGCRPAIEFVWAASALDRISIDDPTIGAFNGATHSRYVSEFGSADRAQISAGAAKVRRAVAEHLVATRNAHPDGDALIAAEVRKKSRYRTLRELTQIAPEVLLALKPCWAMSPLAVSQLLDAKPLFDVVVFDEASQVPPADAIPALMRGRRAIVAGDSKQLPPTAFFASAAADDDGASGPSGGEESRDAGVGNLTSGTESVLDAMANVITSGAMTLRWHYRSKDERLIAFSNAQPTLYDRQMVTFAGTSGGEAMRHVHVPWRAGAGASGDEVARVVELIIEHCRRHPDRSLGVIAMGIEHAERITEALRLARHDDASLDAFCSAGHPDEPLFVKNLERVQGDERDSIILTIGYGKSPTGVMQYRFGPINQAGGERRLNVAITRSRSQMTVVSSFLPNDLDPAKLNSEGARMLGRYLAYAASGGTDLGSGQQQHPPLDPFQLDVQGRLMAAGVPVVAQLGVSGYCIDFAAAHPERPAELVLAIEVDGASYAAAATARERDRLREDHLERLGWAFHRIWSTDWFRDPDAEVTRIVAAWQAACAAADARADAVAVVAAGDPSPTWAPPHVVPSLPLSEPPLSSEVSKSSDASSSSSSSSSSSDVSSSSSDVVDVSSSDVVVVPPPPPPPPSTGQARSLVRPRIVDGKPIADYSDAELLAIVQWAASDDRLRTDGELRELVADEMGYSRVGSRIRQRLDAAIEEYRQRIP